MATSASPRPSITLSSRRTSTSTDTAERSNSTVNSPAPRAKPRRNRAALRDYYGLKPTAAAVSSDTSPAPSPITAAQPDLESELDKDGFDSNKYVTDLLAREGLESVLRTEASLVSETRGLDGEKKALVYDNYSKLISATDTIKKMRMNMDPLTPTTSTLTPAVGHIAETAAALRASLREHAPAIRDTVEETDKRRKQDTVRWVLRSPDRLREMVGQGKMDEARRDWHAVEKLLDKWKGTGGVHELRQRCLEVMQEQPP